MDFPIGYFAFHKSAFLNYQLNRWYSLGFARKQDIEEIGKGIQNFGDYVRLFTLATEKAEAEGRLQNAAIYLRASEFLISPNLPEKKIVYKKFLQLFNQAFAEDLFERHEVPYSGSFLAAMRIPSYLPVTKGTIIGCGGFDSTTEEFYGIWKAFAENGYEVIAFEGPGQGQTLRKYGLPFDHDWEKPTAAICDYFNIQSATAIGLSMGGYWIMRAAAFEKRISRVIAMPPVYDWLELTNGFNRKLVGLLLKWPGLMNFLIRLKMNVGTLKHTVNHALFITGKSKPVDAVKWMLGMNKTHLHSELIDQQVFLIGGENDAFQPPKLLRKQEKALINAHSVDTHIFTQADHADQHCQMGNIGLAVKVMLEWMEKMDHQSADS